MKLTYFTNLNSADGTKTNAHRVCTELDKRDEVDVTVAHIQGTGAPENFWTDELGYDAVYPISLDDGIRETDPDIVLIHGFNADMMDYLEDYIPDDDRVYVLRNGINTMENWLALYATPDPRHVTTPIHKLDMFDGIFAPSVAAAERISFDYGADAPHMAVAPCVINYNHYAPTPFMDDGTLVVVTASRLAPNNYIPAPMLAVRHLSEAVGVDVELHVLGSGDQPYRQTVEQLASGMAEVNVTGHLDSDEVRKYLQGADVVCVPSVTQQAVPTVAVEALAAGNVVVSGDYRAAREEETLIYAPVDHAPTWFEVLEDIAGSPDEARGIIRDGLEAAKDYDVEAVVRESYIPFLQSLMAENEME